MNFPSPEELIRDAVSEGPQLEFKRDLPEKSDKGRFEFLKDVTALANSSGGIIYFGVYERDSVASAICPLKNEPFDDAQVRLGQILDSGVQPRLSFLEYKKFEQGEGYVLALRVPLTFSGPYRLNVTNRSAFYLRNNGNYILDVETTSARMGA